MYIRREELKMKINKRDTLFVAIIFVLFAFMVKECDSYKNLERVVKKSQEEATYWKDKEGQSRGKIADVSGELSTLKVTHKEMLDSLRKEIGSLKKLKSATSVKENISGAVEIKLDTLMMTRTDTLLVPVGRQFKYEDHWVGIWGVVNDSSIFVNYSIDNEIRLIRRDERYGTLKLKKRTIVEAVALNPNAQITGISQITITPKRRRFYLGVGVGYGLSDRLAPSFNVSLQLGYKLIEF